MRKPIHTFSHLILTVEGRFIYIRNLPLNVTVEQLDLEFKKFGPIKQGGMQVINNKQQGYRFRFFEFQSSSPMNNAIQASPIAIVGRKAVIEIKRTTTRVGSRGRGRFSSGEGKVMIATASRAVRIMVAAGHMGEMSMKARVIFSGRGGSLLGVVKVVIKAEGEEVVPWTKLSKMFSYETLWGEFLASIFDKTVYMVNASIIEVQMI